jgi:hypothetical protein
MVVELLKGSGVVMQNDTGFCNWRRLLQVQIFVQKEDVDVVVVVITAVLLS